MPERKKAVPPDELTHLSICTGCRTKRADICIDFMYGGHSQLCKACCQRLHPQIAELAGFNIPEAPAEKSE